MPEQRVDSGGGVAAAKPATVTVAVTPPPAVTDTTADALSTAKKQELSAAVAADGVVAGYVASASAATSKPVATGDDTGAVAISQQKKQEVTTSLTAKGEMGGSASDDRTVASASTAVAPPALWSGWQGALLNGVDAPVTGANKLILTAWLGSCRGQGSYNPLGATKAEPGSTITNALGIQNYPNADIGIAGFKGQLEDGDYKGVLKSLRAGDVDVVKFGTDHKAELEAWPVDTSVYASVAANLDQRSQGGSGSAPSVTVASGLSSAWSDLLNVYDKTVPKTHTKVKNVADSYVDIFKR